MIDSKLFEIFEPNKELKDIMFNILNGEGVKESNKGFEPKIF